MEWSLGAAYSELLGDEVSQRLEHDRAVESLLAQARCERRLQRLGQRLAVLQRDSLDRVLYRIAQSASKTTKAHQGLKVRRGVLTPWARSSMPLYSAARWCSSTRCAIVGVSASDTCAAGSSSVSSTNDASLQANTRRIERAITVRC